MALYIATPSPTGLRVFELIPPGFSPLLLGHSCCGAGLELIRPGFNPLLLYHLFIDAGPQSRVQRTEATNFFFQGLLELALGF